MIELRQKDIESTITPKGGLKFTAILSTDSLDRDSEVVIPSGMYSKDFERNPVLLYAHDATRPIGKVLSLRRGLDDVRGEFEITPRPENYEGEWFPDFVKGLIEAGVIRGISIGFAPMPGGWRVANKADKDRYGDECKGVYSRWNLHEVSVVSVPANQDALIVAIQKGSVTAKQCKEFLGMSPITKAEQKCPDCPDCPETKCPDCPECPKCNEQVVPTEEKEMKNVEVKAEAEPPYRCMVIMAATYIREGDSHKNAIKRAEADCAENPNLFNEYKPKAAEAPAEPDEVAEEEEEEVEEEDENIVAPVAKTYVDRYAIKVNLPPLGWGQVGDIVASEVAKKQGKLRRSK